MMNEHIQESLRQIIQTISSPLSTIASVDTENALSKIRSSLVGSYLTYLEKQKKLTDDLVGLSYEEYNKYFEDKIERAKTLGKFGWVVSPNMVAGSETKIALDLLSGGDEKKYVKEFFYNRNTIFATIKELQDKVATADNLSLYLEMFEKCFRRYDYTSAAVYICGVLDYRMKQAFKQENMRRYGALLNTGIDEERKKYYKETKKENSKSYNIFILTEYITSFQEYAKRTFTEETGYGLGEQEPPYFNRNWLMHGYSTRKVQRFEVLQLLNALSCLETIIDGFKEYKLFSEKK